MVAQRSLASGWLVRRTDDAKLFMRAAGMIQVANQADAELFKVGVRYAEVPRLGVVEVGEMLPSERGLVLDGFVKGYADALGHGPGKPHHGAYKAHCAKHVETLLERANVLVARDAECQALAYGWCCYEPGVVHWTAVKQAFRRRGIGRLLLQAAAPKAYTHRSRFDELAARLGLEYRPLTAERRSA